MKQNATMKTQDFTTTLLVDQSPEEVFNAIMNVRGWWSGLFEEDIKGKSNKIDDEFTFHAGGGAHYSKQKLVELVPGKKVVWLVTDSKLDFLTHKEEWSGTKFGFDIAEQNGKTKIVFTHEGLTPEVECYNACAPAWTQYVQERLLHSLTGKN